MALQDILGIGKVLPIDKLIDIVSFSAGRISKSYFDKKDSDTKAYEIKKLAEARAEEMKIMSKAIKENHLLTGGIIYSDEKLSIESPKRLPNTILNNNTKSNISTQNLEDRTHNRTNYQQNKKQLNLESVTAFAAEELKNEQPISDEPVSKDWTTRFFNIAEDISNEEMQALWGRILAGEIKKPKSFSLRTLELLKNLSKEEAECFMKFCEAKVSTNNTYFIYNQDNGKLLKDEFGITFNDRLLMAELGLISSENDLEFSFQPTLQNKNTIVLNYGKKGIVFYRNENVPKQPIKVLLFTKNGIELSRLVEQTANENYIEEICSSFNHENVIIEYGDLLGAENGQLLLLNKKKYSGNK
jgi:uncharacterized repeat protein (TIGR03899 family)